MCLIVRVPAGETISDDLYWDATMRNSDGVGIMWRSEAGTNKVYRSMDASKALYMVQTLNNAQIEFAVHWRMGTHGRLDESNCHPFRIGDTEVYMMHNGVFSGNYYRHNFLSDTAIFAQDLTYIEKYPELINDTNIRYAIDSIGGSNMLLFLTEEGEFWHTNDKDWLKYDGKLFSNEYAWTGTKKYYDLDYVS